MNASIRLLFVTAVVAALAVPTAWSSNLFAPSPIAQAEDPFVGTFEGEAYKLTIRPNPKTPDYAGALVLDGQSIDFKARKVGDVLKGKLEIQGGSFYFTISIAGDTLTVISDGETYTLKRVGAKTAANPFAAKKKEGEEGAKEKTGAGWKLFRHPLGLSFGYPADWTMKPLEGGIFQLFPFGKESASEAVLIAGLPAEGITDPKDPRIVMGSDELIATQISPLLQRKGGAQPAKDAAGRGIMLTYEGPGADGGKVEARLFTTILKTFSVGMLTLMKPDRLKELEPTLVKIFATFRAGKVEIDSRLVGQWSYVSETIIDSSSSGGRRPGDASLVGNHQRTAALNADGSMALRTQSHSIASGAGVFVENKSDNTEKGNWAASEGKLVLVWDDGTGGEYKYRLENGGATLILEGEGRRVEWRRG